MRLLLLQIHVAAAVTTEATAFAATASCFSRPDVSGRGVLAGQERKESGGGKGEAMIWAEMGQRRAEKRGIETERV